MKKVLFQHIGTRCLHRFDQKQLFIISFEIFQGSILYGYIWARHTHSLLLVKVQIAQSPLTIRVFWVIFLTPEFAAEFPHGLFITFLHCGDSLETLFIETHAELACLLAPLLNEPRPSSSMSYLAIEYFTVIEVFPWLYCGTKRHRK